MTYSHLFVDSDVLLDLLLNREPFFAYSQLLLAESKIHQFRLSTSTLVIANINYIITKATNRITAKEKIKNIIKLIDVLSFETQVLDLVLESDFTDFEDAIQFQIALKNNCDVIITRNIKDYHHSTIPVYTPEQFLRTL